MPKRRAKKMVGLEELLAQLKITNRLTVLALQQAEPGRFGTVRLIEQLAGLGATDAELAELLGTSLGTVQGGQEQVQSKGEQTWETEQRRSGR